MPSPDVLAAALRTCLPVAFGYVPLGMAFGVLLVQSGQPAWLAPLMGLCIYAGAAQFLAVGLLAARVPLADIALATLLLNLRHAFYGLSMIDRLPVRGWRRWYAVFALTDETWSLLTGTRPPPAFATPPAAHDFVFAVSALNQGWWLLGCTLGGLGGLALGGLDTHGLEFTLTALFVVLLVEQWHAVREPWPFLLAASAGAVSFAFAPPAQFLLVALALTLAGLLAAQRARPA
ncbi:MAG TPA: AzlC family ABC transporter permease [Plasticicumulans sp.]|uniref:AzlC family ABC transporter permease n=1 Tax=Plasticicumulans sp. TaxID=2307179 RepID=UPI002BA93B15|nr:AzlC family ABC transporter permease [Plasticicumulans sp.]HMW30198.1 AzlC family ABC transporter permease [Plasticicumulans sp.]HMW42968.1 AzlC family ABC transporter permease [Plasticicumulans sp.]HMX54683.1 AzlC family ABC transporter permease [Plasticicumulans sp.]HMZ11212.1 AzlC family ABC transporter permease [Plasticicumulans sp.]HNB90717.1 AzlC family ABC transporter permease [Plasticicumulans sp.]